MQKEIGGYLNLDLTPSEEVPHTDGVFVNSGRHAIEYILRTIPHIETIWIPFYTCRVVLEPILKLGLKYKRYRINKNLEIAEDITLGKNDFILVSNYFGIKDSYIKKTLSTYGSNVIIDNAHALFTPCCPGYMTAYSPRKMIGVADGGIAYTPFKYNGKALQKDVSYLRSIFLLKRLDLGSAAGYKDSKDCNKSIENTELKEMSSLSKALYFATDFNRIKNTRRENFILLHNALGKWNEFNIPNFEDFSCPLIYPFFFKDSGLRSFLISNNVFVPVYWPYVKEVAPENSTELELMDHIIALPIDQRYGKEEMDYIVRLINRYITGLNK